MSNSEGDSNSSQRMKIDHLPYVAFFWDIENCRVPPNKSASQIVQFFREKFLAKRREADFYVVCDINKEADKVIKELNYENVTVVHVPCVSKNAADDKLKTLINKYSELHKPDDVIVLISGDINFSPELIKARYERKLDIIIIHPENINIALLSSAKEHFVYTDLISSLPNLNMYSNALVPTDTSPLEMMVVVSNLPKHVPEAILRSYLSQLIGPTGGVVAFLSMKEGKANVRFKSMDSTRRGRAHLDGADAFKNRLTATYHETSKLFAEQQTLNGHVPRTLPPHLPHPPHPSQPPTPLLASFSSGVLHHSASVPTNLPLIRPVTRFPSAVSKGQTPFEDRGGGGTFSVVERVADAGCGLIRPPNGKARMPVLKGTGAGAGAGLRPETTPTSGGGELSFFKRAQLEKAKKATELDVLMQKMEKSTLSTGESAKGVASPKKQSAKQQKKEEEERLALTLALSASDPQKSAVGVSSSSPSSSSPEKEEFINVYLLNLNTDMEQSDLYLALLKRLEEEARVNVEHLSLYSEGGGVYAHVAVCQMEDVQRLMESVHGRAWLGGVLTVTKEDPGRSTSVVRDTPIQLSVAVRRAIIRLFLTLKKDEMPFLDLVSYFRREYDQIVDLKMLRNIPEIVQVNDEGGVLMVTLAPTALQSESDWLRKGCLETLPLGYCLKHCPGGATNTALLKKPYKPLGLYRVLLKEFAPRITQMLTKHGGSLPMNSFMVCYDGHFEKLKEDADNGAYLEHLLLSVPGVRIRRQSPDSPRLLELSSTSAKTADDVLTAPEDSSLEQTAFRKAVRDMLVRLPRAAVALSDLAAALHRHCGKLCDVRGCDQSDLIRLLGVSPDIEVIGVGAERMVTLAHHAQLVRFEEERRAMEELLEAKVTEKNVASLFQVTFEPRLFWIGNYGVSYFEDVDVVVETVKVTPPTVALSQPGVAKVTEQSTSLAILSEKTFQLLTGMENYRDDFLRFPNTFHKFFGHQLCCRDFGFDRLADLCHALQDVVEVETVGKERFVVLCRQKRLEHFGQVIERVGSEWGKGDEGAKGAKGGGGEVEISMTAFKKEFQRVTGTEFKRENYGALTDLELFLQFGRLVEVTSARKKLMLRFKNPETSETSGVPRQNNPLKKKKPSSDSDRSASPETPPLRAVVLGGQSTLSAGGKKQADDSGISADEQDARRPPSFVSQRLAMSFN